MVLISHKNIHKYTWHQEKRQLKSTTDFIIVKLKPKLKIQYTRIDRSIECGSHHYLLKSRAEICRYNQEITEWKTKFNINELYDDARGNYIGIDWIRNSIEHI